MLIGPATRDINIDYTGQEVREIGGAVFFCAYAAAAASANLFASVKIHPDDTDVLDAFHLDSDHIAVQMKCIQYIGIVPMWTAACIIWPV